MKYIMAVILALAIILTGCKVVEDSLPAGAEYITTQQTLFNATGQWAGTEYDNESFICLFGYIFNRDAAGDATGNRLIDGTGAEITCDPTIFWRTVITKA